MSVLPDIPGYQLEELDPFDRMEREGVLPISDYTPPEQRFEPPVPEAAPIPTAIERTEDPPMTPIPTAPVRTEDPPMTPFPTATARQSAPPPPPAGPVSTRSDNSRLAVYALDRPLDALAKIHAQYTGGSQMTNSQVVANGAKLVSPLAQVLGRNGAGADAMLRDVARLAWYRQTNGKEGPPEAAPVQYIESWKGAYKAGQPVILSSDLDAQLKENRVSPAAVRQSLQRPEARPPARAPLPGKTFTTPRPTSAGGPKPDASSPNAFLQSVLPYAKQVEQETGIPAAIMVGIAANETGYGKYAGGNNYFGIKGRNPRTGASFNSPTWEVINGQRVDINDTFRSYDNPADSFRDFADFLKDNSRYAPALRVLRTTGDPAAFIRAVHAAGYATDPNWSSQVLSIARNLTA
jgi:flagellum-specific peptidoglycan hydrolase FlgJ